MNKEEKENKEKRKKKRKRKKEKNEKKNEKKKEDTLLVRACGKLAFIAFELIDKLDSKIDLFNGKGKLSKHIRIIIPKSKMITVYLCLRVSFVI